MPPSPDWDALVAADPALREALQAARAWKVPPTVFLDLRRPTTAYTYGPGNRVAHTEDRGWTGEDRVLAIALQRWEAELCPGCGGVLSETTDPANEDRYTADLPTRCHRCTAQVRAAEEYAESPQASALLMRVRLRG